MRPARPASGRSARPAPVRSARAEAHAILVAIDAGRAHSTALLAALPEGMDERDRALATELVYGVLRRRSELDGWIASVASRPIDAIDPDILAALRIGLHQILHLDRVLRPAAVDESVRLARRRRGRAGAAFANAVLRGVCRRLDAPGAGPPPLPGRDTAPAAHLALKHSFPPLLVERWLARFGFPECEALLAAMNRPAPVVLRPAGRAGRSEGPAGTMEGPAGDAAALRERLAAEGVRAGPSPVLPEALRVESGSPQRTAAFRDGWFYIQDEASQIVARLIEPAGEGRSVLDVCAAPGGKLLGALERAGPDRGLWVAADVSLDRLRLLTENAERLRLEGPRLVVMEAARPALRGRFDRILVDAPCSGTGIIRRHPEIRWRRTPSDIAASGRGQAGMLRGAADLAAPGGRIVYAVCSLEPEEGPDVVAGLVRGRDDLRRVDAARILPAGLARLVDPDGALRTLPHRDDIDGFYAAVLEKRE